MIIHQPLSRPHRLTLPRISGDRVAGALGRRLDDAYHYVPHVAPAAAEVIDAVVVGPGGTWALVNGSLHGRYRMRNGHWYSWNRSTESWIPWEARPVLDARLVGHRLELYLERANLPAAVEPCLIVPRGAEVTWEPDQRPGIHVHDDLDGLATRIGRDDVLSQAQVDRIVALLDPRQPLPRLAPSTGS